MGKIPVFNHKQNHRKFNYRKYFIRARENIRASKGLFYYFFFFVDWPGKARAFSFFFLSIILSGIINIIILK